MTDPRDSRPTAGGCRRIAANDRVSGRHFDPVTPPTRRARGAPYFFPPLRDSSVGDALESVFDSERHDDLALERPPK